MKKYNIPEYFKRCFIFLEKKINIFFSACQKKNILPWLLGFTLALTAGT
jgi:hypothetical protein